MTLSISHNEIFFSGYSYNVLKSIFDYMMGQGAGRFTILESQNIDSDNGWFVFELVGGTGWQCWLGAKHTAATWSNTNTYNGSSPDSYKVFIAFSPKGGWDVGSDSPGATMFSQCPSEGGGPLGQFWLKITPTFSSGSSSTHMGSVTLWDDPSEGFFMFLFDRNGDGKWDIGGSAIMPLDSRFGPLDTAPYALLCGSPNILGSSYSWFRATPSSPASYSSMLLPGDSGSPPTRCAIYLEPLKILTAATQATNPTNPVDLPEIGIYTNTTGVQHNRGFIKAAYLRQGLDSDTARRTYDNHNWIVPTPSAKILIPWKKV